MNPGDVAQSALPLTSSDLSLITLFLLVGGPGILCAVRAARRAAPRSPKTPEAVRVPASRLSA